MQPLVQDYDAGEDAWEDSHIGKWIKKIGESMIDLYNWNDVSNTKIPLNEEIFALLVDRHNPEKLRPAVIVAKMMPAKRLTWTESKEGDVLCYDVPAGNFQCCNGAEIKYWKYVNVPSKQAEVEPNPPPKPVAFFDHRNEPDCTTEYLVYDKQEADAYIQWLGQKAGVL